MQVQILLAAPLLREVIEIKMNEEQLKTLCDLDMEFHVGYGERDSIEFYFYQNTKYKDPSLNVYICSNDEVAIAIIDMYGDICFNS